MRAWWVAVSLAAALPITAAIAGPALAATSPPALAMTAPILQQTADGQWTTTVLVEGSPRRCPAGQQNLGAYRLETTSPDRELAPVRASQVTPPQPRQPAIPARSCQVMLTFAGPAAVPATATLLIDGASPVTLTVSRRLTLGDYLYPPVIWGGVMAVALLVLSLAFVRVYDRNGVKLWFWRLLGGRRGFWTYRISASGAWTLNDSWATNIVTTAGLLGTVLGIALSPADTPFHGLGLDRFAVLAALAAGIIAAAPLLFAILYGIWSGLSPGMTDNASVGGPGAAPTRITVRSGAKILVPWGATITDQNGIDKEIKPGDTIPVGPGTDITARGAALAFSAGSDILVQGSGTLRFGKYPPPGSAESDEGGAPVVSGNHVAGYQIGAAETQGEIGAPRDRGGEVSMALHTGGTVTVNGVAEITLPDGVKVKAPGRESRPLSSRRLEFRWPQTANSLVGTMWMMIATALVTIFGIGAELGIAWELGTRLSDASPTGHDWIFGIILALGICAQAYSVTAICTMADPQPGSSMSATPGTSFTL